MDFEERPLRKATFMKNFEELTKLFESKGIKPSLQRLLLYSYMRDCHDHPTVEKIYADLAAQGHALSKATVYNTLTLFVQKGLLRMVGLDHNEARYDILTGDHAHFVCERCGAIYDVAVDFERLNLLFPQAEQIKQRDIFYRGTCKRCAPKEDSPNTDETNR
jgi:Fe2+ or Zn2+ uptake regulation protein